MKQAAAGMRAKKFTPVDLTEACLDSIKTWNPKIDAWITVMRDKALAQAKELASEQAAGRLRSPLHGIPIGLKDSIANWREVDVLALAHAYQGATDWHLRRPPLTADAKVPVLSKAAAAETGEAVAR